MPDPLAKLGRKGVAAVEQFAAFLRLCWETIRAFFIIYPTGRRVVARVGVNQIYFTGVQALPMLSLIAVLLGIVAVVNLAMFLPRFGAGGYMGRILIIVILREFGPLLTAIILITRSGTAIAADLASMSVNDEIAALKVMDISVPRVIIAPRLIGAIVSCACLTVCFVAVAITSGFIAANCFTSLPLDAFAQNLVASIEGKDLVVSLAKSVGFGMIVALLSCHYGLLVKQSPTEIPQAVTRATVASVVWCFIYAALLTVISIGI